MRIGVMLRAIEERQGIGIYSRNLMDELLGLDENNEYVFFYRNPELVGRYGDHAQVTEEALPARSKALWDQWAVPAAARRHHVDLVFHTKFTVPFLTSRKCIMTIHGASWFVHPELYQPLDIAYIRTVMPLYCRKADFIISNSELTTRDFRKILKVPEEKIRTIPLGRSPRFRVIEDSARLEEARRRYRLPDKYILAVVKYDPRKNFENLIEAFRRLRLRQPDVKLVVVGIGCEKYIDEYDLKADGTIDAVTFQGWVEQEDLPALYNLAHCLFFPSVYEEFGIPTIEAMGCGCPPVVARTGNLPELAGEGGLIVDPFNPDEMADALEKIWTDEKLRARLSQLSLQRADLYTWRRCAQETLEVINQVGPQ